MNNLLLVYVCALVAHCAAQDSPAPAANLLSSFNALLPENVCGPSCNGVCNAQRAFCISVPPLVDCDFNLQQCQALCQIACDCLTNCRSQCEARNECPSEQGIQNLLCQGRVNTCVGLCQASCPLRTNFIVSQQALQIAFRQLQSFLSALQPQAPQ